MMTTSFTYLAVLVAYAYALPGAFTPGVHSPQAMDANAQLLYSRKATVPSFQIVDPSFSNILGPNATFVQIAVNSTFAFAHEAPIWAPDTNRLYFASNDGGPLGDSGINKNNVVSYISLDEVNTAITQAGVNKTVNVGVTRLSLPDTVQMINGGTGPYQGSLLLFNSGRGSLPSTIALANPKSPYNATILLDNYTGKQFNSLNDGKVHPKSGNIFFTDPSYGYLNRFRPAPQLPNQVYRFDPKTKAVKIVADRFDQPNGIAFTADGKTAYITDTGNVSKMSGVDKAQRSIIFAFDVDSTTEAFTNRRVFAYVDSGIPDGIQLDTNGNVYSGCGDGVHVWNSAGTLLGKFYIGTTSANMVFANGGDLFILAETKIYLARLGSAKGQNLST